MSNVSGSGSLRRRSAAACGLLASTLLVVCAARIGAADRSVWDGVYARAQVQRGQSVYKEQCALCHGDRPASGAAGAPPLAGAEFLAAFADKSVADLFEKIRKTMPADDPGTVRPAQIADALAYLFSENKWPAGPKALGTNLEILKQIRIIAKPSH